MEEMRLGARALAFGGEAGGFRGLGRVVGCLEGSGVQCVGAEARREGRGGEPVGADLG